MRRLGGNKKHSKSPKRGGGSSNSNSPRGSSIGNGDAGCKRLLKTTTFFLCGSFILVFVTIIWCTVLLKWDNPNNEDEPGNIAAADTTASAIANAISSFNTQSLMSYSMSDVQSQKLVLQLESAQRRIKELEDQLSSKTAKGGEEGQDTASSSSSSCPPTITSNQQQQSIPQQIQQAFVHQNPICSQILPHPIPTASSLWTAHLAQIHKASQLPNDHRYYFHDFTAQLLHLISPRLPQSVGTLPRDVYWSQIDTILRIAHKRYDYVKNPDSYEQRQTIPRPVKIVIMGGSLLVGMNCRKIIRDLGFQLRLPLQDCSWANRLEKLINQFLVGQLMPRATGEQQLQQSVVQVTKIAMGGTNTQTASTILEYDLIPPQAKNPDIIINAYSTNDLHILTQIEAQSGNTTLREKVFDMIQEFVRRVLTTTDNNECTSTTSTPQQPPLLLHIDDYLGNEQREILATTELSQSVQTLANYYGFATASYANLVRDWVYGDTHEYWFSPEGWYDTTTSSGQSGAEGSGELLRATGGEASEGQETMLREIHPNMGMHIVAAWVVAYNLLTWTVEFCSLEGWNLHNNNNPITNTQPQQQRRMEYNNTKLNNLPILNGMRWPLGKPKAPPNQIRYLPPPLTKTLSLEEISKIWWKDQDQDQQSQQSQQDCSTSNTNNGGGSPTVKCPFSWLSGISSVLEKPNAVKSYFEQHLTTVQWGNWKFMDDHGKLGIVPQQQEQEDGSTTGGSDVLKVELVLTQPIRKVTIFYMKSYGERWQDTLLKVQCSSGAAMMTRKLSGFHDKHTSETYTEVMEFKGTPIPTGSTLRLGMQLLGGQTFKIMGIAICS